MRNRCVRFVAKGVAKIVEGEIGAPGPNQVLVNTRRTLISSGTELAFFEGRHSWFKTGKTTFPCGCGYSNVGIIESVGDQVTEYHKGERVFSLAGHAERYLATTDKIIRIPKGLADEKAAFATVGSVALHGIRGCHLQIGETLLILGQGLIGQLALRLARLTGVRIIIAADAYKERLKISRQGGADYTINITNMSLEDEIKKITEGQGANVVIEASGSPEAVISALKVAANRGRIIILGCPHGTVELDLYSELQTKELSLIGSYQPNCPQIETPYYPWTQQGNRQAIFQYLQEGKINLSELITHRMAFHKAKELYTLLSKHKDKALAAIIEWEEAK